MKWVFFNFCSEVCVCVYACVWNKYYVDFFMFISKLKSIQSEYLKNKTYRTEAYNYIEMTKKKGRYRSVPFKQCILFKILKLY